MQLCLCELLSGIQGGRAYRTWTAITKVDGLAGWLAGWLTYLRYLGIYVAALANDVLDPGALTGLESSLGRFVQGATWRLQAHGDPETESKGSRAGTRAAGG